MWVRTVCMQVYADVGRKWKGNPKFTSYFMLDEQIILIYFENWNWIKFFTKSNLLHGLPGGKGWQRFSESNSVTITSVEQHYVLCGINKIGCCRIAPFRMILNIKPLNILSHTNLFRRSFLYWGFKNKFFRSIVICGIFFRDFSTVECKSFRIKLNHLIIVAVFFALARINIFICYSMKGVGFFLSICLVK